MRTPLCTAIGIVCALALAACGESADRVEISDTSTRSEHSRVPRVNVPSEERFAVAMPRTAPPMTAAALLESPFDYTAPEDWIEIEATQFRNPNFLAGPNGEIEIYVSMLPGGGGGLLVNANRWRGQMGQEPYTQAEFQEQPSATVLGHEAVVVDVEGVFTGMGGAAPQEGFRLVGVLVETAGTGVFIKMVGPDELVEAERDNFARFAQSLRLKGQAQTLTATQQSSMPSSGILPPDHPDISASDVLASVPPSDSGEGDFTWETPDGWQELDHASSMRLVTFSLGEDYPGECYVVVLGGSGGGRLNNMNRWLDQMGEPPLEQSELDLQPKIALFGEFVPMLIAKGIYTGMGGTSRPGSLLLGASGEIGGQTVFIKLVGPEAVVNANWDNFTAFCASLELSHSG